MTGLRSGERKVNTQITRASSFVSTLEFDSGTRSRRECRVAGMPMRVGCAAGLSSPRRCMRMGQSYGFRRLMTWMGGAPRNGGSLAV
jgi:hypothetical protein